MGEMSNICLNNFKEIKTFETVRVDHKVAKMEYQMAGHMNMLSFLMVE